YWGVWVERRSGRARRAGNDRALGPDSKAGGCRSVPICPQSDDQRRGDDAAGRNAGLGVMADRRLVPGVRRGEPRLFRAVGRAGFGAAFCAELSDLQGERAAVDTAIEAVARVTQGTRSHREAGTAHV